MKELQISSDLGLPPEVVTEKLGFLGRTGSGKTYAAQKLAELMYGIGAQFIALDPVGKWWSLRLAADGKSPGLSLPVFGGLSGDIPLEPGAGKMIADVIVDRGISAVVDVSQFESDADKARFVTDFGARLFFRKKAEPSAVHIFVEEAQEFVPQNPQRDEARMLHVWTRIQKLGRNFGIGTSLLSQRPQEVNKKVLNQTELLFVFQLTGPQEREAIANWIEDKGIDEDIAADLPKLKQGAPHAWSPAWLQISRVVKIGDKTTYDASSTPKVGAKRQTVKELSPIDLEKLQQDMQTVIEKAKADDPRALRTKIAELERKLAAKPAAETKIVEKPVVTDAQVKRVEGVASRIEAEGKKRVEAAEKLAESGRELVQQAREFATALAKAAGNAPPIAQRTSPPLHRVTVVPVAKPRVAPRHPASEANSSEVGGGGLRRILIALAQRNGLTNRQIGVRAGLSSSSGSFSTYMSRARSNGWISDNGDRRFITDAGIEALGSYDPLPTGRALLDHWLSELGDSGAARILRALASAYPDTMTNEEIGEAAEISHSSGSFSTYMSRLRTLELVEGGRGATKASDELFIEEATTA